MIAAMGLEPGTVDETLCARSRPPAEVAAALGVGSRRRRRASCGGCAPRAAAGWSTTIGLVPGRRALAPVTVAGRGRVDLRRAGRARFGGARRGRHDHPRRRRRARWPAARGAAGRTAADALPGRQHRGRPGRCSSRASTTWPTRSRSPSTGAGRARGRAHELRRSGRRRRRRLAGDVRAGGRGRRDASRSRATSRTISSTPSPAGRSRTHASGWVRSPRRSPRCARTVGQRRDRGRLAFGSQLDGMVAADAARRAAAAGADLDGSPRGRRVRRGRGADRPGAAARAHRLQPRSRPRRGQDRLAAQRNRPDEHAAARWFLLPGSFVAWQARPASWRSTRRMRRRAMLLDVA